MKKPEEEIHKFLRSKSASFCMAGGAAYCAGIAVTECPYEHGTAEAALWMSGWYGSLGAILEKEGGGASA